MTDKRIRTMEDFSALAGLSRPTVSRYFSDPNSVRASTRARIEAALAESGFRPNHFAVNLNRRRSNILGIVVPDQTDPFYMALTREVERRCAEAGFFALFLSSDGDAAREAEAIGRLTSMNVAGAIIAPLGAGSQRDRLRALGAEIPLVFIDSPLEEAAHFVGTDNRQSVGLIVDYLLRSGAPPCYLGMPEVNANARLRRTAYVEAMTRAGAEPVLLPVEMRADWNADWDFERFGHETLRALLAAGGLPTATLLCANDRIALGALSAAWNAGLRVGRDPGCDLRIAGHDDHPFARYACPALTTVAQDRERIARTAARMLLEGAEGSPAQTLLKGELVLRASA